MKVSSHLLLAVLLLFSSLCSAKNLPEIIDDIRGSIVAVGSITPLKYKPKAKPRAKYLGTGFVAGSGNLVVTNYHVIPTKLDEENREQLAVFSGRGKNARVHTAELIRSDKEHDLALLRISAPGLKPMKLHNGGWLREGEEVAFTGFPIGMVLGLYPITHKGIVSRCPPWRAKRRRVVPGSREATRETRRAEGAKGDPKGASERGVQSYGRPVCSRNELAMLWRNAG